MSADLSRSSQLAPPDVATPVREPGGGVAAPGSSAASIELSIVLPCLNEAETLEVCIRKALTSMAELGVQGEVIIADNGSADGSQAIATAAGARVVDIPRRGYGAALRGGFDAARGSYVLMADADDSYALDDIGPFLEALRGGAELVMGNRFHGGIKPGAMPFLHRYLGNPVLSRAGRLFFHIPVGDFHCGMRAFRRDRILALGMRTDGMEFASEMVVRSALSGVRMSEVPTTLSPAGRTRAPHLNTWRDGWRHLRFLLAFSPRWLLLYPALAMTTLGLLGLIWLSFGTVDVGAVSFSVHTMLACATLIVLGLQTGGLGLVSRAYAARINLLPPSPRLESWVERVTIERGLIGGALSVVAGLVAFAYALVDWGAGGFGELDPVETMRWPILGMVLIIAGTQVAVVAFAMSLTGIGQEPQD